MEMSRHSRKMVMPRLVPISPAINLPAKELPTFCVVSLIRSRARVGSNPFHLKRAPASRLHDLNAPVFVCFPR